MAWGKSLLLTIPLVLSGIFVVASPASADQVGTATNWSSVSTGGSHTCGLRSGKLYCWGNNDSGQVGNGDDSRQDVPDQIGSSDAWTAVSAGAAHTCGIRASKLFCWGSNSEGQLGNGGASGQDTPDQVSNASWRSVSAGGSHTCAIRNDNILACWGSDESGQIGNGTGVNGPSRPAQVSRAAWKVISAGGSHTCGIRTDGMIACWGNDSEGQVGNGSSPSASVPAQISGGTWRSVSAGGEHTCAIRTDGVLGCWGSNARGQIGNGTFTRQLAPKQITSLKDWRVASAGGAHTCATRGALYCWGDDTYGQVTAISSSTARPSPVRRYSTVADFTTTDAGHRMSCAIRTNGKLYCWGGIEPTVECPVQPYSRPSTIDLSYWKLTTPVDGGDSGSTADEVKYGGTPLNLATLDGQAYFEKFDNGDIRFRANAGGATTSGSSYPRSELREMTQDGEYDEAAWDRSSGTHIMRIHQSINYNLVNKRDVVAGQIHDGDNDMLQIRLEGTKLLMTTDDGNNSEVLDPSYTLGSAFDLQIQADQCGVTVTYDGDTHPTVPFADDNGSWYFKAGVYTQSNTDYDGSTTYGEVTIYGLDVVHSS